jgi:lipopolysaccharide export system permease protein
VINKNVPVGDMLLLFSYIIPRFLEIAIPMSLLLAIILAFGRLSSDSEIIVIRATGLSIKSLAYPVLFFAFAALIVTGIITFWVRPWASHRLEVGMFEIARMQASAGLVSGVFNDLGQLTIYAEKIEENGNKLTNVIISDRRNTNLLQIFFAKHGQLISDEQNRLLNLKLYDGSIQEGSGQDFNVTYFEITSVRLPHGELLEESPERGGKKSGEMYINELKGAVTSLQHIVSTDPKLRRNLARYEVEFHKRIALPCSCLCIALIAMALGIQPSRGGHTWGAAANAAMGISLILFYYILFAVVSTIAEQAQAPAAVVLWLPNALFAALGLYLLEKTGSEQWLAVSEAIGDTVTALAAKLRFTSAPQGD